MSRSPLYRLFFTAAICLSLAFSVLATPAMAAGGEWESRMQKPAILLAAFGTTELSALSALTNVKDQVKTAFPGYDVYMAFSSNMIVDIWRKRDQDAAYRSKNPGISEEFYKIGNPLSVLGAIQSRGPRVVLVQSLHVVAGEEFFSLKSAIDQLEGIKAGQRRLHPFPWIGIGAPALGLGKAPGYGNAMALEAAAKALAPLVDIAKKNNQALVLMGHGNGKMDQPVYANLEKVMRKMYNPNIYIGLVEGEPGTLEQVMAAMKKGAKMEGGLYLAPLMVVAGDHTINDLVGPEPDSWASTFKKAGYKISSEVKGLGTFNTWAAIYVNHLKTLEIEVKKKQAADLKK